MIKKNIVIMFVLASFLTGCTMHKQVKPTPIILEQQEIIAKFADLPDAPFQVQLQKIAVCSDSHDQLQAFYTSTMPYDDLITFYQQQMERLGWDLFAESTMHNCLMHYNKPEQFCSILITKNDLSIYICKKKGA